MARARKTKVCTAGIVFNVDGVTEILPRLPRVMFGAIAEPTNLKLQVTSKRASIIGVTVFEDGVDKVLLILSSSNKEGVNVWRDSENVKAGDMDFLGLLSK